LKDNNRYDIIIEAVGRKQQKTMRESIKLIKLKGKIVVTGVFEEGYEGNLPFRELFYKEVSLIGSNSYSTFQGRNEFDIALEIIENKEINLSDLITHILPLSEFEKGLNLMKNKKESGCIKVIYRP
jgi:threonine dehydrogenase-like Zn-dependent dehydrogenase